MLRVSTILFYCLVLSSAYAVQLGGNLEGRTELLKKLFDKYDENIIPNNVTTKLAISLHYFDVNTEKNELDSQVHLIQCWFDKRLAWDNSSNGIDVIHVSTKKIWKPDIILYNSVDFKKMQNCHDVDKVVIFPTGYIVWVTPCNLQSRCNFTNINACGEQKCQWKFGSWLYDKELLDIDLTEDKGVNLEEFGSQKWKVIETNAERNEKTFGGYPNPYSDLTFNLTILKIDNTNCV